MDFHTDDQRAQVHTAFVLHILQKNVPPRNALELNKLLETHLDAWTGKLGIYIIYCLGK